MRFLSLLLSVIETVESESRTCRVGNCSIPSPRRFLGGLEYGDFGGRLISSAVSSANTEVGAAALSDAFG